MTSATVRLLCLALFLPAAAFAQTPLVPAQTPQLPAKAPHDDMAADASHLINDLPTLSAPPDTPDDGAPLSAQDAKTRLGRAQKKMLRFQKLLKDGVVSQMEVERCTIELAEALARYEHSNLTELQRQLTSAQDRVKQGSADQALVDAASTAVESATASTAKADAQMMQTKFDLAKINLARQQKLFSEKLISRVALREAEDLVQRVTEEKEAQAAVKKPE